jgi:hypothetical protein
VVALMEDRAKIEIQAHAVLPLWRPPSFAVW